MRNRIKDLYLKKLSSKEFVTYSNGGLSYYWCSRDDGIGACYLEHYFSTDLKKIEKVEKNNKILDEETRAWLYW